jgi:hypothetical protein
MKNRSLIFVAISFSFEAKKKHLLLLLLLVAVAMYPKHEDVQIGYTTVCNISAP